MATKPRARRKIEGNPAASLIAALKFIEPAQKKVGTPQQQFSMMLNHWLVASNGVLTIGTKIEEDLQAFPHTLQLLDALSKVSGDLTIGQINEGCMSVTSGAFNALIPCAAPFDILPPDPQIAVINDRIRDALDSVQVLATDGAPDAVCAAVLLQGQTAVATNRHAIIEHFHGVDLPPNLLLPKASVQAIVKTKKPLTGFGFSESSATFYFDDGSFIKTQLYKENYPDYQRLLNVPTNAFPLPQGFFSAVHAIESFSENGQVFFKKGVMHSHPDSGKATTYKVEGLSDDMGFNSKYLIMLELGIKTADFQPLQRKMFFFGNDCRGCIMGLDVITEEGDNEETYEPQTPMKHKVKSTSGYDIDDDIPF